MIVVDSNIIAYWFLPGEKMAEAESVWQKDSNWIVPPLWKSEFRNILAQYLRHKKLSLPETQSLLKEAETILEHKVYKVDSDWVLRLVNISSCSAYDCEYVSLAQRFGVLLVTADNEVLREFPGTAVSPQQFIDG